MSKNAFPHRHETPMVRRLAGSFAPNGAGAIDQTQIKGRGVTSITRTGVGTYLVQLEDVWKDVIFAAVFAQFAAITDVKVQVTSVTLAPGAGLGTQVVISAINDSALNTAQLVEIAANAGNRVHFELDVYDGS